MQCSPLHSSLDSRDDVNPSGGATAGPLRAGRPELSTAQVRRDVPSLGDDVDPYASGVACGDGVKAKRKLWHRQPQLSLAHQQARCMHAQHTQSIQAQHKNVSLELRT